MAEKKKMGRPPKEIDQHNFEQLCAMQCTLEEVCGFFDISPKTLERWCKETYKDENGNGLSFSKVFEKKRINGVISLRRAGFRMAETNPSVWIFHMKNLCGWKDNPDGTKAPAEPIRIVIEKPEGGNARTQAE